MKESTNFQKIQNCTRPALPSEEMILLSEAKTSENLLCLSCTKSDKSVPWLKLSTLLKNYTRSYKVQSIANWDILVDGVDLLKCGYGLCRRMLLCISPKRSFTFTIILFPMTIYVEVTDCILP